MKNQILRNHQLFGFCVLPCLGMVPISFFFFDAPGSTENPLILILAWSIWSYPLVYLIGVATSCFLYRMGNLPLALSASRLPALNFISFGFAFIAGFFT